MTAPPSPAMCPRCGARQVVHIVYGYPTAELERRAEAGKVILGGCLRDPEERTRACLACHHRWHPKSKAAPSTAI
jgi:hypothetical protein